MQIKSPLTHLPIRTAGSGFYRGFSRDVTVAAKLIVGGLILWVIVLPTQAASLLGAVNTFILSSFNYWYVYAGAFFFLACAALAIWPATGRLKLGLDHEEPEFSNFSWFSMMFGAGIGVGMLTFATAEPMYHFAENPSTIMGLADGSTQGNVRNAYVWSFTHWGFAAWACFAIVGLSLAYFSYRRGLPLTIRSGLTPIFGKSLSGTTGHVVDIMAVVATVLGVSQTLGFGAEQFISGLSQIGVGDWLYVTAADGTRSSSAWGIVVALLVIMSASTLSAVSGVGRGIKWLSNINMVLSLVVLAFFVVFGSTIYGFTTLFVGIFDYVVSIPANLFRVWPKDGTETGDALAAWQGSWTIFYWAWWISFAPFVGMFLARISKGRTIREFVLGAMVVPSLMCFIWFALAGGTAIDLELSGTAQGAIADVGQADQLFAMLAVILDAPLTYLMSVLVVILLLTFLVTTADSAMLVINTINAGGDEGPKARPHIIFWGVALSLVVGGLIILGGLSAVQMAMVIGALPFSMVMVLMAVSLIKAVYRDGQRLKQGVPTTYSVKGI